MAEAKQMNMFGVDRPEEEPKDDSITGKLYRKAQADYEKGLPGPYGPAPIKLEEEHLEAIRTLQELATNGHFEVYFSRHYVGLDRHTFKATMDPVNCSWEDGSAYGMHDGMIVRCSALYREEFVKWKGVSVDE